MITLITGLPGASKTLYTLSVVDAIAKAENRPVFYSGISDLTLEGWNEIEADKWFECPPKSLVVIDECQRVFRPRTNGTVPPPHVSELETHRHKGIDLFMVTQHPMLADTALRRLSGRHFHIVRQFGMQRSTVHEWPSVKDICDKPAGRVDSIKHLWSFNKSMFDKYKSAEVHTVKRSIPMRVKLLLCIPILLAGLAYVIYRSMEAKIHPKDPVTGAVVAGQSVPGVVGKSGSYKNALDDAKQYLYEQTPRIASLPHTAPRYDEVTKPVTAPIPSACMSSRTGCTCFSQQGTRMQVDQALCTKIVQDGFFVDFDAGGGGGRGSSKADEVLQSRSERVGGGQSHETPTSIVNNMSIPNAKGVL
jgi:zona occludens toxin